MKREERRIKSPIRKIIIATDSFKGSLSAIDACSAVADAVALEFPDCEVIQLPVADGGEGTVDCFAVAMPEARRCRWTVSGPYGEKLQVQGLVAEGRAVLEMAACAGLPLVEGRENPAATTTYGVGEMIGQALQLGCKSIVLGIGGSCTNDGGAGMAAALGVVFRDAHGREFVPVGGTISQIADYDASAAVKRLAGVEITAMCDVGSPMHGPLGAAHVFAPQKGASPADVELLDAGLRHLDGVITRKLGRSVADIPGAGAAGAMGAGVIAFLGGALKSGVDTVLDVVGFDAHLADADLVFTGEGRIDGQSSRGKVVSGVARRAKTAGVPVVALGGSIAPDADALYALGVTAMFGINRTAGTFEQVRGLAKENFRETLLAVLRILN